MLIGLCGLGHAFMSVLHLTLIASVWVQGNTCAQVSSPIDLTVFPREPFLAISSCFSLLKLLAALLFYLCLEVLASLNGFPPHSFLFLTNP